MSHLTMQQMELNYRMAEMEAYQKVKNILSPEVIIEQFPDLAKFLPKPKPN